MTIKRYQVGPRMSQAVAHGDKVYLAGLVADDTSQSVAGQTRQILDKVDALLKAAGTDKTKLLRANIWLADIAHFAEMNSVWDSWVSPGNTPARATVQSPLAGPQYKVEIMVEAAAGKSRAGGGGPASRKAKKPRRRR
jgi:enamine deaminase RidA (YjgF/YER057c/UK114 family)